MSDMNDRPQLPEDDEPILLEHDDVITRLQKYRRRTATATDELVDLTTAEAEAQADVFVIPDAEEPSSY